MWTFLMTCAMAGQAFDEPLLTMIPATQVADTEGVWLEWLALDADGEPMADRDLVITASSGSIGEAEVLAPGRFRVSYVPTKQAEEVVFDATLGDASGSATMTVNRNKRPKLSLPHSAPLLLGKTTSVPVKGASRWRAQNGLMKGRTDATFELPKVNYPQLGLIMGEAPLGVGFTAVELVGAVDFPVDAPTGTMVRMKVGENTYGPVQAKEGQAIVSIQVPPGVDEATQINTAAGKTTETTIDLGIPKTPTLALGPLPKHVLAGASIPVSMLHAKYDVPQGESAVFAAGRGEVSGTRYEDIELALGGRTLGVRLAQARWTAPSSSGEVDVQASIFKQPVNKQTATLMVEENDAPSVIISESDDVLKRVTIKGEAVHHVSVGRATANPTDNTLDVQPEQGLVRVAAWPAKPVVYGPVRQLVVLPDDDAVAFGQATHIRIAALSAGGLAVRNVDISLEVVGDGSLEQSTVTTSDGGVATVVLQGGDTSELLTVRATSDGVMGSGSVVQLPRAIDINLRPTQSTYDRINQRLWEDRIVVASYVEPDENGDTPAFVYTPNDESQRVWGTGQGTSEQTENTTTDDPNAVTELVLEVNPADAAPGQAVTVRVTGYSGDEAVALTTPPTFTATGGELGEATQDGDGWAVQWIRPEGDASVSAKLLDTSTSWRTTGTPWIDDSRETKRTQPAQPRWLRARVSGTAGSYRYAQLPDASPGPLLDKILAMGGTRGGTPARPVGVEGEVRAFIPGADFLGAMGRIRASYYAIDSELFTDPAEDWLVNGAGYLLLRAPISFGGNRLWLGGRGGFRYDDVLTFTGCTDPGCRINFDGVGLPGLGAGAEVGAEVGKLSFIAGFEQGFAQARYAHSQSIDVHLGYEIASPLLLDVGFLTDTRTMPLEGRASETLRGSIEDNQWMFTVGLGLAL